MIHFNGGTVSLVSSFSPLGMYAGYLLMQSGNFWPAISFLILTVLFFAISVASLSRFIINLHRNKHALEAK